MLGLTFTFPAAADLKWVLNLKRYIGVGVSKMLDSVAAVP